MSAGGGSSSAAVSPAIAVSPPAAGTAGNNPGVSLNFSASSLAGSSVTSGGGAGGGSGAGMSAADQVSGQLLADCDPARLAALSYPRLAGAAGGLSSMYSAAASYPSTDQNPYPSIAMENSFYGTLVSLKVKKSINFGVNTRLKWAKRGIEILAEMF